MGGSQKPEPDYVSSYLKMYAQPPSTVSVAIPIGTQASGQPQLAHRNNNPGNLQYAGQQGAVPGDSGFAKFETPEAGFQALIHQVSLDQTRGLPLGAFIAKYAPAYENDTARYVAQASQAMGVDPGTPLSHIPVQSLAEFIARKESGTTVKNQLPVGGPPAALQGTIGQPYGQPTNAPQAGAGTHPGSGANF